MLTKAFEANNNERHGAYKAQIFKYLDRIKKFLHENDIEQAFVNQDPNFLKHELQTIVSTNTTPSIRLYVAFLADEEDVDAILNTMDFLATPRFEACITVEKLLKQQLFNPSRLLHLIENPHKFISEQKLQQLKAYIKQHQSAFDFCDFGLYILKLPMTFRAIVSATIDYIRKTGPAPSINSIWGTIDQSTAVPTNSTRSFVLNSNSSKNLSRRTTKKKLSAFARCHKVCSSISSLPSSCSYKDIEKAKENNAKGAGKRVSLIKLAAAPKSPKPRFKKRVTVKTKKIPLRQDYINKRRDPVGRTDKVAFQIPNIEMMMVKSNDELSGINADSQINSSINLEDEALVKDTQYFLSLPNSMPSNKSLSVNSKTNSLRASSVKLPPLKMTASMILRSHKSSRDFS